MHAKTLIAAALLHPAQLATLVKTTVNALIVLGSISGFFGNLYNDLTAFALAMATFFFGWAALLYMTANQNENHRVQAQKRPVCGTERIGAGHSCPDHCGSRQRCSKWPVVFFQFSRGIRRQS